MACGVDRFLCLKFDRSIAEMSPEDFIRELLVEGVGVRHLVVGDDFRFGRNRAGDFATLEEAGRSFGFEVVDTPSFEIDGLRVSSTAAIWKSCRLVKKSTSAGTRAASGAILFRSSVKAFRKPGMPKAMASLVAAMADLAIEELTHYREVVKWIHSRGLITAADEKDPYVVAFRKAIRSGSEEYFLDRLLTASIIEARGAERFALVAAALPASGLQKFYESIARSEARHYQLFLDLAQQYIDQSSIETRWDELLDIEAAIARELPLRAALH